MNERQHNLLGSSRRFLYFPPDFSNFLSELHCGKGIPSLEPLSRLDCNWVSVCYNPLLTKILDPRLDLVSIWEVYCRILEGFKVCSVWSEKNEYIIRTWRLTCVNQSMRKQMRGENNIKFWWSRELTQLDGKKKRRAPKGLANKLCIL